VTYAITKSWRFSAAHHLHQLPDGHKCKRNHGHNYVVTVRLEWPLLDPVGMVEDYGALDPIGHWIKRELDHRDLNETLPGRAGEMPTAELLAQFVFDTWAPKFVALREVTVQETAGTSASYREEHQ
jgi:6-pyruvoyltetrahydropterin/6-carboxytetrahydropterin synthase